MAEIVDEWEVIENGEVVDEGEVVQDLFCDERTNQLSEGEIMLLRLSKLCKDAQVPNYFYNQMIGIMRDAITADVNATKVVLTYTNRNQFLRRLSQLFPVPRPLKTVVGLETGNSGSHVEYNGRAQLIHWDPTLALMSILGIDSVFADPKNVTKVGNNEDRFIQTNPNLSENTEILHGSWARNYIQDRHDWVDGLDLLCPIVLYMDETHVTGNGRVKVTPILMACGLLNKNVRYLQENIKPLAYVPKHDPESYATKKNWTQGTAKGRSIRNFHSILSVVVRSLIEMKEKLLKKRTIVRIGKVHKRMRLHCPIAFFVGDAKEMDKVAARYGAYNSNRISRWCDTSFADCGTPGHRCREWLAAETKDTVLELNRWKFMDKTEMNSLEGTKQQRTQKRNEKVRMLTKKLHDVSAHRVVNSVWETMDDLQTVLPLPHDMMHIFTRICRLMFELTICCLSKSDQSKLDKLVEQLMGKHRSSETPRFPRMTFTGGFCAISNLTSGEWIGKLFTLMILAHLPKGKEAMKQCFERARARKLSAEQNDTDDDTAANKKRKKNAKGRGPEDELPPLNEITSDEVVDLFEDLLLFHAYYTVGWPYDRGAQPPSESSIYYWSVEKEEMLRNYIGGLQHKMTTRFPRRLGNGYRFQKFHEVLHLARCISLYGMPDNYNADWGERALKQYGKKPGRLVKKKMDDEMLENLADKIGEMDVIDQAYSVCVLQPDLEEEQDIVDNGWELVEDGWDREIAHGHEKHAKYICTVGNGILLGLQWPGKRKLKKVPSIPEAIINYFVDTYSHCNDGRIIYGYTEYTIRRTGVNDDMKFRCHPCYKSGGPWYDWCLVRFGSTKGSTYPEDPEERFMGSGLTGLEQIPCKMLAIFRVEDRNGIGKTKILVHPCAGSSHSRDTYLTESWKKDSISGLRSIPAMDQDGNILPEGEGSIQVRYPKLEEIEPDMIEQPLFVVEEDPAIRVYSVADNKDHSANIILVRDRIEHWSLNFDYKLTKTEYKERS